jgi:adenine-specific DNA-methyltransferase
MASTVQVQQTFPWIAEYPEIVEGYPQLRFMGSKYRLLPWLHEVFSQLAFDTALDGFSGSGCVGYLLKAMGKEVLSTDFLNFSTTIAKAIVENPGVQVSGGDLESLLAYDPHQSHFIERTFEGVFFTVEDLRFLDRVWCNLRKCKDPYKRAIAIAAMVRSCAKRQPRGVFTVAGDPEHYKDGRRDLRLSIKEHFVEQIAVYNGACFDNRRRNLAVRSDIFEVDPTGLDLVYLDPPYVPRSDDNCYVKRYHFLEGLSCYWEGVEILEGSIVKKIKKPYTPFSYRKSALDAFDRLFRRFSGSIIVLSYSSNGYPDLDVLVRMLSRYKGSVTVFRKPHRYHFGTHESALRNEVIEYLIVGA